MARKTILFTLISLLLLAAAGAVPPQASDTPFEALRAAAEREYAEKSYSRAHTLYESALKLELKADRAGQSRRRTAGRPCPGTV